MAYVQCHTILVMTVNIFFLGKTDKTAEKCAIMVRMTGKSGKDNVIASSCGGDVSPRETEYRVSLDSSVYEPVKQELDYNHETGLFVWKSRHPNKLRHNGRVAGTTNSEGYTIIRVNGRAFHAHRLAWFFFYGEVPQGGLDHINRNPLDNRIANLRLATVSQNRANARARGKCLRGVKPKKSGKFEARIKKHGKCIYLGVYDTEQDAHAAYMSAAQVLHGEFACDAKGRDD